MLTKLKVESGVQFTQKMEGMFNDMRISADTTKSYLEHVSKTTVRICRFLKEYLLMHPLGARD